jgi:hypothetical protein
MSTETEVDEAFHQRSNAHIALSNQQYQQGANLHMVGASGLYGAARYCAYVSAAGFENGPDMASKRAETIEFFMGRFRLMLESHLDDYIFNFDAFMKPNS